MRSASKCISLLVTQHFNICRLSEAALLAQSSLVVVAAAAAFWATPLLRDRRPFESRANNRESCALHPSKSLTLSRASPFHPNSILQSPIAILHSQPPSNCHLILGPQAQENQLTTSARLGLSARAAHIQIRAVDKRAHNLYHLPLSSRPPEHLHAAERFARPMSRDRSPFGHSVARQKP